MQKPIFHIKTGAGGIEDEDLTSSTLRRTAGEENLQKTVKISCFEDI